MALTGGVARIFPPEMPPRTFCALLAVFGGLNFPGSADAGEPTVRKIADGFRFIEGPVFLPDGSLIFSDIPADVLLRWDGRNLPGVFRRPSGQANGNTLDREGRLVTCEHWNRRVTRTEKNGEVTVLADAFEGKPLNSPNDAVVKSDGSVWFTDPSYGAGDRGEAQPVRGVYRLDPESKRLTLVAKGFDQPNGLCFSPDEKRLYVADSAAPHHIRAFDVRDDGTLANDRVFAVIERGGPDGIRCAKNGDLYSSEDRGVAIFGPDGKMKGLIPVPETPANLCFSPDEKKIYATARHGLYEITL